jgi:hypothetical protein
MRVLLFTVLLLSVSYAGQDQNQPKNRKAQANQDAQGSPKKPPIVQEFPSPTPQPSSQGEKTTPKPESKPWLIHAEWAMAILTCIYVILTGAYVWVSLLTLNAIQRQGKHAEDQAGTSTEQFNKQLSTMEAQVVAMSKSAEAAKASADAAEKTAKALINSEAASIMVSIVMDNSNVRSVSDSTGDRTEIYFNYICINQGRTAAWIIQKGFRFLILDSMPDEPDLESIGSLQLEPESVDAHQESQRQFSWECRGHIRHENIALIWGVVKYEDVFGNQRWSRFGYKIKPNNILERINLPAYNKRT